MKRSSSVEQYIADALDWQGELLVLRKILKSTDLLETLKWGAPCYTLDGKNVVGLAAFKSYVGLWFHQGALLKDRHGVLVSAQGGKTRALRQWRFDSIQDIDADQIRAYVKEAITLQRRGVRIAPQRNKPLAIPDLLQNALSQHPEAGGQFLALTKSKQREYAEYITDAKREQTRLTRLNKIIPMIVEGHGLNDRYRK